MWYGVLWLCIVSQISGTPALSPGTRSVPNLLNYSGFLANSSDTTPVNGNLTMTFSIWSEATGGTQYWSETHPNVEVNRGYFHVLLGSSTPLPDSIFDGRDLYLEIAIGSEVLSPRKRIVSAAHAFHSLYADTALFNLGGYWSLQDNVLFTKGPYGLARVGNTLYGDSAYTHVNLGVSSTTGASDHPYPYAAVLSGFANSAQNQGAVVTGGQHNQVLGSFSSITGGGYNTIRGDVGFIGGGVLNEIESGSPNATIGGGYGNKTYGQYATIGGGHANVTLDEAATIAGGAYDSAGYYATVGGGYRNRAKESYSTVAGGRENTTSGQYATVAGGVANEASGSYATVSGGISNAAGGATSVVAGGNHNEASGSYASVLGGNRNQAAGDYATVGGGTDNFAGGTNSVICGGSSDTVTTGAYVSVIAGGDHNKILGIRAGILSGAYNRVKDKYGAILGGYNNVTEREASTVGGGKWNRAYGTFSGVFSGVKNWAVDSSTFVGGGIKNIAYEDFAVVAGGDTNVVDSAYGFIGGGSYNLVDGKYGVIAGGSHNTIDAGGDFSTISGGKWNEINYHSSYSAILGGFGNYITADSFAAIVGGRNNEANGVYSFAMGDHVIVNGDVSFGFGQNFVSSANNAVIFKDPGNTMKLGINTTDPTHNLEVNGNAVIEGQVNGGLNGVLEVTNTGTGDGIRIEQTGEDGLVVKNVPHYGVISQATTCALYIENNSTGWRNPTFYVNNAHGDTSDEMLARLAAANDTKFYFGATGSAYADGGWYTFKRNSKGEYESFSAIESERQEIVAHGRAKLRNGEAYIEFPESFVEFVSDKEPIDITVTPKSSALLYIPEQDNHGFRVKCDFGDQNAEFTWIAIGVEKGKEVRATVPNIAHEDSVFAAMMEKERSEREQEMAERQTYRKTRPKPVRQMQPPRKPQPAKP